MLYSAASQWLLLDVQRCLELLQTEKRRQHSLRLSLASTVEVGTALPHSPRFTPIDLSQYFLSLSEEVVRNRHFARAEDIDLLESQDRRRAVGSLRSSVGPQSDFELVLDSELRSVRLSPVDVNVDIGAIDPIAVGRPSAANAPTAKKKRKQAADRACCVAAVSLRQWVADCCDLVAWRCCPPPGGDSLISSALFAALKSVAVCETHLNPSIAPAKLDDPELFDPPILTPEHRESFALGDEDLVLLPEPEVQVQLADFETPKTHAEPKLEDLLLPNQREFAFEEALADNPKMKPASVFLQLLCLVQHGEIELLQQAPFAPLRVRPALCF